MASKRLRIVWAAAGVLAVFGALFAPVVLLPLLALAAVVARRLSQRAAGPKAYLPPVVFLALVGAAPWLQRFKWPPPAPPSVPEVCSSWVDAYIVPFWALSPVEYLVFMDPYYGGLILPVLILLVPLALGVAITIALVRP